MRPRIRRIPPAGILALLIFGVAGSVRAGAWKLEVQGAKALETSYAGAAATAEDVSTVWFNPAGMTRLGDAAVTLGGPVIDLSIDVRDRGTGLLPDFLFPGGTTRPVISTINYNAGKVRLDRRRFYLAAEMDDLREIQSTICRRPHRVVPYFEARERNLLLTAIPSKTHPKIAPELYQDPGFGAAGVSIG